MYKIQLTHGRHYERASGEPHASPEATLKGSIEYAKALVCQEKARRGDGLLDGYRILDERGVQVHADWVGLNPPC
jgi:hypothetical protein